jgi:hypothetical protein
VCLCVCVGMRIKTTNESSFLYAFGTRL